MELVDRIMSYEQGDMTEEEMIDFFQELLDENLLGQLQGHYGRTGHALVQAGLITPRKEAA